MRRAAAMVLLAACSGRTAHRLDSHAARGRAILAATADSLPGHVGNALRCTSCHLDDGRRPQALPLTSAAHSYPQYRARTGRIETLEERINNCLLRSMNGTALDRNDPALHDIVAYLGWLAVDISRPTDTALARFPATGGDTARGHVIYAEQCARCHGSNGGGNRIYPPLWGPMSFNIGAGMARLRTAAAFIEGNMPFDRIGILGDSAALDVAAYMTAQSRPDFAGKQFDWPHGDPPPDVPYTTIAGHRAPPDTARRP